MLANDYSDKAILRRLSVCTWKTKLRIAFSTLIYMSANAAKMYSLRRLERPVAYDLCVPSVVDDSYVSNSALFLQHKAFPKVWSL